MMLPKLLTALALLMVFEGIFPFISPGGYKRAVGAMLKLPENNLRIFGLVLMVVGVVLLYVVNR